jgi:hypothetical protein
MVLAAAALAAATGPTWAANFGSSAMLTGMRYELIDLRPGDGIAASAQFLVGGTALDATLFGPGGARVIDGDSFFSAPGASRMVSVSQGGSYAASSISFNGRGPNLSALGSTDGGAFDRYMANISTGGQGFNALLSPYTAIRWTGTYALDAWSSTSALKTPWRNGAGAELFMLGADSKRSLFSDSNSVVARSNPTKGPSEAHEAGSFSFLLTNDTASNFNVGAMVWTKAYGGSLAIAAVPEPSTYALFAAGIGVVGVVARRRRTDG